MKIHYCPSGGFTLIELIVVLLITGILAVTVAPRLQQSAIDEGGFVTEVLTAARYAQKIAVSTGCNVQFASNTATDTYAITYTGVPAVCAGIAGPVFNPGAGGNFTGTAPNGVNITTTTAVFDDIGRSSTGIQTITITGSGTHTITIEGETGYVHQ